ncbi:septum formation family protein [Corynebacterium massiliense]|mgnify:FL=1|uniref:Membrane protein n=1 Tax=Corynebacterium massiliense DSM 45435 TaxID=1121364 RepID=A0ABY7UBX3_9CORY|nr:septum formation family protein [Corynebacterium massiliense]WCZ33372.1 putative membrane protein [Corynebacterium massiliense DSM 45435]
MGDKNTWRSATGVRSMLVGALAAAVFTGSYEHFSADEPENEAEGTQQSTSATHAAPPESFTTADTGSCLMWDTKDGKVSNFQQASCDDEHRFEVSSRTDLATYPTAEFGPDAPRPDVERQAQLREELCKGATTNYLNGRYDPNGRFSVAPILPPADAWEKGDRTMLCGLQTTGEDGTPLPTKGKVATQDQANIAQPGTCRAIDDKQVLHDVPCDQPHQLETTAVIDLTEKFGDDYPSIEDQDKFLAERCTEEAENFAGGKDQLAQTTLQPYWGTVAETSWNGGTHSVNCSLMHARTGGDGFAELNGSAKDHVTIDGEDPKPNEANQSPAAGQNTQQQNADQQGTNQQNAGQQGAGQPDVQS